MEVKWRLSNKTRFPEIRSVEMSPLHARLTNREFNSKLHCGQLWKDMDNIGYQDSHSGIATVN